MPILKYKRFYLLYRLVSTLLKFAPIPNWVTVKTPYGITLMPKSFRMITAKFGMVEPEMKVYMQNFLRETNYFIAFIDIGTAYGYYTLIAAKLMRNCFILAFEPDFVFYKVLEANLSINDIRNAKPSNIALSDIDGEISIQGKRVRAKRLDSLLQEEGIELKDNA